MLVIQAEEGEGSRHPSEPQPPPSPAQPTNKEPIPKIVSSSNQKTQTPRQALNQVTELPQTSEPIPNVPYEAVYEEWDDRVERATTTTASLDIEQASGGSPRCQEAMRGSIAQTKSKRVPTPPHDSPLLRLNTLGSDEGSMTLQELTVLCTTLSKKVESLEVDLKQTKQVYGAAYTKLIMKVKKLEKTVKTSHSRRRAKIVVSDDEEALEDSSKHERMIEEIDQDAGVTLVTPTQGEDHPEDQLGVLNVAKILADAANTKVHTYTRKRRAVSTGSGGISTASRLFSTAGASMPVSTAGKDKMEESKDEQIKRTKLQQEQDRLGHEVDVRLQEELDEEERQRMARVHEHMGSHTLQQLKRYSFDELKELFETTPKNVNTFVPMETEDRERASELAAGSSQATITNSAEVGSSKRAVEAELDHEEPTDDKERTLWVELKRLFEPNTSDTLWKLQRYMHDPLKWRLYDTCGVHHVSTERGTDIFMLVEKEYPLSKGVMTLMLVNKLLVEQHSEMANELLRKILIQANRSRQ
ncbi:hypothetical protein Tco_1049127 [Tanacetum coccineum]